MKLHAALVVAVLLSAVSIDAQTSGDSNTSASVSVPSVIQFSTVAMDPAGGPLTRTVNMTFSLYTNAQGGEPLWKENQSVTPDGSGNYSVYLGITKANGLPASLFVTGQALWLGVQVAGEVEQSRIALVSVPYAIEAGNAATIGGLPPSAFVKANSTPTSQAGKNANPAVETQNYIPLFINSSGGLGNSILYQSGTTAVGIGTTTPSATLEVNGTTKFDGLAGFASGQTFPGTLTGITAGTGITVSGSASNPTVGINTAIANQDYAQLKAANTFAANQTINASVNVATDLREDYNGANQGTYTPGIRFGVGNTGEAISSDRAGTVNVNGIDFYTDFTRRLSIANNGMVGINTATPVAQLDVLAPSTQGNGINGIDVTGGNSGTVGGGSGLMATGGEGGSDGVGGAGVTATGGMGGCCIDGNEGFNAGDGLDAYGGPGTSAGGGNGVVAIGAPAGGAGEFGGDGVGGIFTGGNAESGPINGDGIDGIAGSGYGGNFTGDVNTTGAYLVNGFSAIEIDHPLDPANKYLVHASVESSEMMNIYSGNATTDARGEATVDLPEWFEVLNTDFRYQLTVIGQFAQAIVSREIENHQFNIKTNAPNVKVSWQVTGVRQDAFAKAHPLVVEKDKEARLRGYYTHPELYGAPEEKQIEWARHPQMMKKIQEIRQAQRQRPQATGTSALGRPATTASTAQH
jgi:trimeric autotransporter adhesin